LGTICSVFCVATLMRDAVLIRVGTWIQIDMSSAWCIEESPLALR